MRAATSVALIALLAAPVFAAPISSTPVEEEPSISTQIISSAAGGAASGAVGNLLSKLESLFRRDFDERSTGALTNIVKQAQSLSAADKATVKTALMNKISTLQNKRDDSELEARAPLSSTSLGGSLLSSAAGGAASGLVGNLLGEIESLFRRDNAELEARAGLGGAIASSVAGGAASGLVGNLLGEIESLFKRDDSALEARAPLSSTSLGGSLLSSAAGGAASGLVGNLLGEIESLFRRGVTDVHDEELYVKRDVSSISSIITQAQTLSASDKATVKTALMNKIGTLQTPSKRLSASGAAGTALGGLASVGANSIVSGLLSSIESLFKRDEADTLMAREETMMKLHAMQRRSPLSSTSLGGSLLSSAAGGAASGLVGNLLGEIESLFKRDDGELEARAPLSATSLGGSIVSSAAGGAASGLVGNLLGEIESLFRRDEAELEARAGLGGAIASSVAGGAASGLVGNLLGEIESLFRRSEEFGINELD